MTPKAALPTDPCQLLTIAQDALIKLLTGTAVISVETPQLGRVEYNRADTDKLQRLVDQLTSQCNAQQGVTTTSGRKPFSFESWP